MNFSIFTNTSQIKKNISLPSHKHKSRRNLPFLEKNVKGKNIENYFAFDMSIPDCVQYIKNEIKIFTRRSEFEPESKLDKHSIGIWLDLF